MNDITRQMILIFLFYVVITGIGFYLIHLSQATAKQIFLIAIGIALLSPLSDFIIGMIKGFFR